MPISLLPNVCLHPTISLLIPTLACFTFIFWFLSCSWVMIYFYRSNQYLRFLRTSGGNKADLGQTTKLRARDFDSGSADDMRGG